MEESHPGIERAEHSRKGKRSVSKRSKLLVGGIVIVVVVVYLVVSAASGGATFYMTVGELRSRGPSTRSARVTGNVIGESIVWRAKDLVLQFDIADESGLLSVEYHGPRPDMLRDEAEAVAEGRYTTDGIFEATSLLLKCPSKYEEEE